MCQPSPVKFCSSWASLFCIPGLSCGPTSFISYISVPTSFHINPQNTWLPVFLLTQCIWKNTTKFLITYLSVHKRPEILKIQGQLLLSQPKRLILCSFSSSSPTLQLSGQIKVLCLFLMLASKPLLCPSFCLQGPKPPHHVFL